MQLSIKMSSQAACKNNRQCNQCSPIYITSKWLLWTSTFYQIKNIQCDECSRIFCEFSMSSTYSKNQSSLIHERLIIWAGSYNESFKKESFNLNQSKLTKAITELQVIITCLKHYGTPQIQRSKQTEGIKHIYSSIFCILRGFHGTTQYSPLKSTQI